VGSSMSCMDWRKALNTALLLAFFALPLWFAGGALILEWHYHPGWESEGGDDPIYVPDERPYGVTPEYLFGIFATCRDLSLLGLLLAAAAAAISKWAGNWPQKRLTNILCAGFFAELLVIAYIWSRFLRGGFGP